MNYKTCFNKIDNDARLNDINQRIKTSDPNPEAFEQMQSDD